MNDEPAGRCERKYPLFVRELVRFRAWQHTHGQTLLRAHPTRIVNNIYFVSPDWASYSDNTAGVSARTKLRLRWYGGLETATEATLEVKSRRNSWGHKRQQRIPFDSLPLRSLPIARLVARLRPLLDERLRLELDHHHWPVLHNRFRREYYETAGGLRMTVDTDMAFAALPGGPLSKLRPIRGAVPAVVEIKYPPERRQEVVEVFRRFPFRATRFSKFVVGIDHLFPH